MTTMARFRRVAQLWDWLPAFRGVAEHESIQKAASALGVSPSALSRTIKLLEEALGARLFERQTTGLRLTKFGEDLLGVTRDAMRLVDDSIAAHDTRLGRRNVFRVGATSELASLVAAASITLDPHRTIELRHATDETIAEDLLQGNLDLVVTESVLPATSGLVTKSIGRATQGVYVSARHPLAAKGGDDATLESARFVTQDVGFPDRDRVAVYTETLQATSVVCERTTLVAVLPDLIARGRSGLVRLRDGEGGPSLAVIHRKPAASRKESPAVEALVRSFAEALR